MVLVNFWRYPDPYQRFLIRIRIRPNDTDPTGSGSGSETLITSIHKFDLSGSADIFVMTQITQQKKVKQSFCLKILSI